MFRVLARASVIAGLLACGASANAQSAGGAGPTIGVGISTLGLIGEISFKPFSSFVVRANGNWASVDRSAKLTDADVEGSMRIAGAGLIGD